MKYFIPKRYLAMQDFSSDDAMNVADAEWENAVAEYQMYLQGILSDLPASVVDLMNGYYLHDAEILSMGRHGATFVIVLQLDVPPNDLLTISYVLAGEPVIDRAAFKAAERGPRTFWMYEELEAIDVRGEKQFVHSVLLSNGWELKLPFQDVQVTTSQPVFPVHRRQFAARSA